MLEELGQRGDSGERRNATNHLEQAHTAYDEERYSDALDSGELALALFESILQIGKGDGEGKIRFLSVSGSVEYRRGERGTWRVDHGFRLDGGPLRRPRRETIPGS